jgi:hypothetical protein
MYQLFSIQRSQPFGVFNSSGYASTVYRLANRFLVAIRRPDLIAVIGFCAIGLILTLAAMARSPDFVAAIAQIGAVP